MPTPTQVANRRAARPVERHYPATVITAGPPSTVALDPGGVQTVATPLGSSAYPADTRVLVLVTAFGNFIIGRLA